MATAQDKEKLKLEREKFEWEQKNAQKGHFFRTYFLPATSVLITLIVAFIGVLSYCQQRDSKAAELEMKQEELKLNFVDRERKEANESRRDFDIFLEKYKNEPTFRGADINQRKAVADKILQRFSTISPNLIIDYFRSFRDEEKPGDNKPSDEEKNCQDECICKNSVLEYYKRACLMNYVRYKANSKITVYLFGSNPQQLEIAKKIIEDEGFTIGKATDPDYTLIKEKNPVSSVGEVKFFYRQDDTFANTIESRLNEHLQNTSQSNFRKIFKLETDYQNSRKIGIMIPDLVQLN